MLPGLVIVGALFTLLTIHVKENRYRLYFENFYWGPYDIFLRENDVGKEKNPFLKIKLSVLNNNLNNYIKNIEQLNNW